VRRVLRARLPELAYWFGLHPSDLDDLPYVELHEFIDALDDLPPPGAVWLAQPPRR
jgi:hypothetical protein